MQPISEIFKEAGLFTWIFLGISSVAITMVVIGAVKMKREDGMGSWVSVIPFHSITFVLVVVGMVLYCANDSVKRRKEFDQQRKMYEGQLVARQAAPLMEEEKSVALDRRLQSIDGMIGYLDQSIKMGQEPKDVTPIMLFLAKEIKNIRDGK